MIRTKREYVSNPILMIKRRQSHVLNVFYGFQKSHSVSRLKLFAVIAPSKGRYLTDNDTTFWEECLTHKITCFCTKYHILIINSEVRVHMCTASIRLEIFSEVW